MYQDYHYKTTNKGSIAYRTIGPDDGEPILYFTGGQSSRLDGLQFTEELEKLNIRLFTFDRPGIGASTNFVNRTLFDWADIVFELCQQLGIQKTSVFGLSGGGPHALALAYKYPDFVKNVSLISSASPWGYKGRYKGLWFPIKVIYFMAKHKPKMMVKILHSQHKSLLNKEAYKKQLKQYLPEADKDLFQRKPKVLDLFIDSGIEAYKNGITGDLDEWRIYVSPWGFELSEINRPINLWYGRYDKQAPYHMGQYMKNLLPQASLKVVEDGGHLSTINNHIEAILQELIQ